MKSLQCIVSGNVSGSNFLAWVLDQAASLELQGWVRHLDDQRVEVMAQGDEGRCMELRLRLANGSAFSGMNSVREEWLENEDPCKGFSMR